MVGLCTSTCTSASHPRPLYLIAKRSSPTIARIIFIQLSAVESCFVRSCVWVFRVRFLPIVILSKLVLRGGFNISSCVCSTLVLGSALKLSLVLFDWLINSGRQLNVVSVTLIVFEIRDSSSSFVQQRRTVGKHDANCGHWKLLR